jgi:hypothetical protein
VRWTRLRALPAGCIGPPEGGSRLRHSLLAGFLPSSRLFRALLRTGTRRPGSTNEKLITLEGHSHGEDDQRESAGADRQVHQRQGATGHSCDENPDRDYD